MALHGFAQLKDNSAEESVRRRRSLVILTPLVDVVFILLVFFMLASSFSDRRVIGMLTPSAARQAVSMESPNAVLIRIRSDGALDFSGEPMTSARLAQEIATRSLDDESFNYLVQPDKGVSLQQLISVVDLMKLSGARNVSLTRKPRS